VGVTIEQRRRITTRSIFEVGYVTAVAVLTTVAASNPHEFRRGAWAAVLVLSLPALIPMLPVLYIAGSTVFNITGARDGGTGWPVTVTYMAVFIVTAVVNVVFLRIAVRHLHVRRHLEPTAG
jgi:uncharacterized membrane protein YjjB (DUF3815 family)